MSRWREMFGRGWKTAKRKVTYGEAFGDVPQDILDKIASARGRVPLEVRGMLLGVLTEPDDKTLWGALKDWAEEFVARPESVEINGERVPIDEVKPQPWWCKVARINAETMGTLCNSSRGALTSESRSMYRGISLRVICTMTAEDLDALPWWGRKSVEKMRKFLASVGLHLKGDKLDPGEDGTGSGPDGPDANDPPTA